MAGDLETTGRVWKLLKTTQVHENFLKIQFGINISEKNNSLHENEKSSIHCSDAKPAPIWASLC